MLACLLAVHVGPLHPYQEGQTPLHAAAKAGQARCCELLLGPRNKDPFRNQLLHRRDNHNWNALMWAAHGGHAAAVVALLRAGAEMSDTLEVGEGPVVGGAAGCRGQRGL
jgi:ankyrin repeat protein